ncbi:MAG: GGDEF domain-containing protein, partial [Mesorhizobium sp.]
MTKPTATPPAQAWKDVAWLTVLGTAACLILSLGLNYLLLFSEALTPFARSVITATLVPVAIGLPLFLLLGSK